ncbi:MAG: hypothetical protein ACI308_02530 [Muribaculaceae bacterium]
MKNLHIFNPDNDLALASGLAHYTAPPLAAKLARDLQMLPAWWAQEGDYILSQNLDHDGEWAKHLSNTFDINIRPINRNHLQNHCFNYQPWGWNQSLRNQLIGDCVPPEQLPGSKEIDLWRKLSHRRITIDIHREMAKILGFSACQPPTELFSLSEVEQFARLHPRCFLKAPWSSSGKGIFRPTGTPLDNVTFKQWAHGILQRQGSIIAELPLNNVQDFAMEYLCRNGKAKFVGYSIFSNNQHNAFDTATVAPHRLMQMAIACKLPNHHLIVEIEHAMRQVLNQIVAPHYTGYLGVDMLIFCDEIGNRHINPCVELNLRCTMGVLTAIVGQRFMHPRSIATYHVEYHKAPFNMQQYMAEKCRQNPPVIETIDQFPKIKSGVIAMTPVYDDSQYCAYLHAQSI